MKYLYILIGLFLIYSAFSYARFLYVLKTNHLPKIQQTDQVLGQGQKIIYVAGGDSTSVGVGASSVENTYTYKLALELAKTNQVDYFNVGVSGAKTRDVINNQIDQIVSKNPDIITLSIGANDVTHLLNNQVIINNFKIIIDKLLKETHAEIYLTNIPILDRAPLLPYPYRLIMEAKSKVIDSELFKLKSDRVHIVPIHTFGWDEFKDIKVTFADDKFHPSDVGYENWTQAFLSVIK